MAKVIVVGGNTMAQCAYQLMQRGEITEEQYEEIENRLRNSSDEDRADKVM